MFGLEKTATGLKKEQDDSHESDDEAEQVHFGSSDETTRTLRYAR